MFNLLTVVCHITLFLPQGRSVTPMVGTTFALHETYWQVDFEKSMKQIRYTPVGHDYVMDVESNLCLIKRR